MSYKNKNRPVQKSQEKGKHTQPQGQQKPQDRGSIFAFNRENYKLLLIGLGLIILGFILMIGGGSDDPDVFNDTMFNFTKLTLAPILILAGYVVEIFAIMKRPKKNE